MRKENGKREMWKEKRSEEKRRNEKKKTKKNRKEKKGIVKKRKEKKRDEERRREIKIKGEKRRQTGRWWRGGRHIAGCNNCEEARTTTTTMTAKHEKRRWLCREIIVVIKRNCKKNCFLLAGSWPMSLGFESITWQALRLGKQRKGLTIFNNVRTYQCVHTVHPSIILNYWMIKNVHKMP